MKKIFFLSIFFIIFNLLSITPQAQWVQANGPYGAYNGAVTSIAVIGIYFYRLEAGSYSETKKLILLK